jgi:hypothetical protein
MVESIKSWIEGIASFAEDLLSVVEGSEVEPLLSMSRALVASLELPGSLGDKDDVLLNFDSPLKLLNIVS